MECISTTVYSILIHDSLEDKIQSALGYIIRDSNDIIKMIVFRHIGKSSIVIAECITLRDVILAIKNKRVFQT